MKYAEKLIKEDASGDIVKDISKATIILQDSKETVDVGGVKSFVWEKFINWLIPKKD